MGAPCAGPLSGMDECPIPPRESIQGLPGAVFVQHSLSLVGVSALAEATSFGEVGMSFTRIEAMTSGFGWKFALEAVGVAVAGAALTASGATVEAGALGVIGSTFSITL